MIRFVLICVSVVLTLVGPAFALDLKLPTNAQQTIERDSKLDSYVIPLSPILNSEMKTFLIEGQVRRSAWRFASPSLTTLQVLKPLRRQLQMDGYNIVLDCDQASCGGFDFRFGVEVIPAPDMQVNVRAFRFVTALKGEATAPHEVVTLLISVSQTAAFVQIIQAGQLEQEKVKISTTAAVPASSSEPATATVDDVSLEAVLLSKGAVVLNGLAFATGTSDLGDGPFPVLQELATFFAKREDVRLVLVGHTDSIGALDFNIALSKRRAASVRKRLLDNYGLDGARIEAEGNGYLAPIKSNLDEEGRMANRRVEAIVLPLR